MTRHTLSRTNPTARLQTTGAGAPVSRYTVKERGHGSLKLIEETYGHTETRHQSPVVEFREAQVVSIERAR